MAGGPVACSSGKGVGPWEHADEQQVALRAMAATCGIAAGHAREEGGWRFAGRMGGHG